MRKLLLDEFTLRRDQLLTLGDKLRQQHETVKDAVEALVLYLDARGFELVRIGLALVAQGIELRGRDNSRR